eukprot:SAG11_NODE_21795_length_418_cov_1.771160_1_plen_66_part_01
MPVGIMRRHARALRYRVPGYLKGIFVLLRYGYTRIRVQTAVGGLAYLRWSFNRFILRVWYTECVWY